MTQGHRLENGDPGLGLPRCMHRTRELQMGRLCKLSGIQQMLVVRSPLDIGQRRQQQHLDVSLPSGRNGCLGFQIWSKFNVSGLRLFLIQGHCVLVSINTEINTTLQSAPFINGVTHLMRALLTHINLLFRRGPSRNPRQLPGWIYSVSAFGKSSHPASTFSFQKRKREKP